MLLRFLALVIALMVVHELFQALTVSLDCLSGRVRACAEVDQRYEPAPPRGLRAPWDGQ